MSDATSPRPWRVIEEDGTSSRPTIRTVDANGDWVCDNEQYYPNHVTEENQRHIALCVNSHDALVGALEATLALLIGHYENWPEARPNYTIGLAEAALALAQPEKERSL